jgi:hypothetical protein
MASIWDAQGNATKNGETPEEIAAEKKKKAAIAKYKERRERGRQIGLFGAQLN